MVDIKQAPEKSLIDIAEAFYYALLEFYEDPENQKAYEKWAAERREKNGK